MVGCGLKGTVAQPLIHLALNQRREALCCWVISKPSSEILEHSFDQEGELDSNRLPLCDLDILLLSGSNTPPDQAAQVFLVATGQGCRQGVSEVFRIRRFRLLERRVRTQ